MLLITTFAVVSPVPANAAIPCEPQPELTIDTARAAMIQASDLSVEDVLTGDGPADSSTPVSSVVASPVTSMESRAQGPTENMVRCLLYNDLAAFATLLTPEYRAERLGILAADQAPTVMREAGSIRLVEIGDTTVAGDNRFRTDAGILLDDERFLVATLEFVLVDGLPYLDDSHVTRADDVTASIEVTLHDGVIEPAAFVVTADAVTRVSIDHAGDVPARYALESGDGEVLREGRVDPDSYAGPPDDSVLVLYDLVPGEYRLTITARGNPLTNAHEIVITVQP